MTDVSEHTHSGHLLQMISLRGGQEEAENRLRGGH